MIGRSVVGDDVVISQGTGVINREVPAGSMAFPGANGQLIFKPRPADLMGEYFRP